MPDVQPAQVLVLGGGFAGAFAARALAKALPANSKVELISDRNYFVFQPLLPEVAAGTINALDAVTPLRAMLKGLTVRMGEVRAIDFEARSVEIVQGSKRVPKYRTYDHLVLALGQRTNVDMLPGFAEHGLCMRDLTDAHKLRNHVLLCLEHADVTDDVELKKRLLTFVIAGGGFSGVEVAGELSEMIDRTVAAYPSVDRDQVRTVIVQRGPRLLPELPERLGQYAQIKLSERGVEVMLNTNLTAASGTNVFTDVGAIGCKTLVTTVGSVATELVEKLDLPKARGRIIVDRTLNVREGVWAIGDAALVPMSLQGDVSGEVFAPTTAQFAVAEAKHVAANIAATVQGQSVRPFDYMPKGTMASIGRYRAVAELFGVRISGLFAWLLWRGFYLSMLPGFATRLRVALNWFFDYFLPRSTVQTEPEMSRGVKRLCFSEGDVLFEPGQFVDGFYCVVSGKLESRVPSPSPPSSQSRDASADFVRLLDPGDHWGERSLNGGFKTQGFLTAVTDSTVLRLNPDEFRMLTKTLPMLQDYFERIPDSVYPQQLRDGYKQAPISDKESFS